MCSRSTQSTSPLESHLLGLESLTTQNFIEAEAQFKAALAQNQDIPSAWSDLGIAVFRQGRLNEALEYFKKAVEIDSRFAKGWSNLGNALIGCGLINDAISVCRTAVALEPNL